MKLNKFTCGLIGGAILGILFAPDHGANTRHAICAGFRGLKNGTKKLFGSKEEKELDAIAKFIDENADKLTDKTKEKLVKIAAK